MKSLDVVAPIVTDNWPSVGESDSVTDITCCVPAMKYRREPASVDSEDWPLAKSSLVMVNPLE